jgi:molecular chaperone DnaJ
MTLEEAALGLEKELSVPHSVTCKECGGSGAEKGTSPKKCPKCGGRGQVQSVRRQGYSQFVSIYPCDSCGGKGISIEHPCPECRSRGVTQKMDTIQIKVPPGVDTGLRLRIQGEGEAGRRGGPPGDLYVMLHVRKHSRFVRDGDDIYMEAEVPLTTAALGGELEVPTLDGTARVTIPAGTQSHTKFRLGGKGMPRFGRGSHGDEYVIVKVLTPKGLSDRQKELLREFAKESGEELEDKKPFFRKFKK